MTKSDLKELNVIILFGLIGYIFGGLIWLFSVKLEYGFLLFEKIERVEIIKTGSQYSYLIFGVCFIIFQELGIYVGSEKSKTIKFAVLFFAIVSFSVIILKHFYVLALIKMSI